MTASPVDNPGSRYRTWAGVLAVVLLIAALHAWRYWDYVVDDIFITLRYARHLHEGVGLVFNPGERVEGYTNFASLLIAAACFRFGLQPIVVLKVISAVASVWTLWIASRLEQRVSGTISPPLSPLLLLPLGAYVYWAASPMETMLFAALFVTALWLLVIEAELDAWRGSTVVFVLLALVRPEGIFIFAVATATFALGECLRRRSARPLGRHAVAAAIFIVPIGLYTIWRVAYFGELLPNTFYARVVDGTVQLTAGIAALSQWTVAQPLFAATLLYPLLAASARMRARWRLPWALHCLYFVALSQVLYVVAIGGDFMPYHRFFVFGLPLVAVVAAALLRALTQSQSHRAQIAAAVVAAHAVAGLAMEQPYRALVAHRTAVVGERVGEWLASALDPTDLIALNTAGAVPYFSDLPAVDMLGLTEPQIAHRPVYVVSAQWTAHRRGWGEHVLSRRPRIILWYNSAGSHEPHYLSDRELANNPFFRFFYRFDRKHIEPRDRDAPVGTFLGRAIGADTDTRVPDLGLRLSYVSTPVPHTTLREAEVVVEYFERDGRDELLWPDVWEQRGDAAALVAAASARWQREPGASGDVQPAPEVLALCERARALIEAEKFAEAKQVLAEATRRNRSPRSPLVYQHIANLATRTGELFTAIAAQKEALRLSPQNSLYQQNLRHLLSVPYEQVARAHREATAPSDRIPPN